MKMRKILSFVLVLSLVLGSFSMAFAATPSDVVGTPNAEAVEVLMGLGIVNGYPDGTYKPENIVTRAEMAKLIVVALGLENYATGTSKYPDMAGATWAQGYVNYATGLGILKGYPDGTFKPSATVSYAEASAMIVRALGYTDASLLPATWPANYVVKAKALGILDGVTASAAGANRGDIAEMLYNALTVSMVAVDSDNKISTLDPTDNMLLRLGAEVEEDVVVYGNEDTLINLVPYTGTYGDVYYIDDEVVAVAVASDTITGDYVAASGVVNASTSDDTDYSISATIAAKSVPYFWNGVEEPTSSRHPKYSVDTMSTATGHNDIAVDLSGKRINDVYAISYWQLSGHGLFEDVDADDIADDQTLFGFDFILDDNDEIDYNQFVIEGAANLDAIEEDDVVYVYDGWHGAGIKKIQVGTEVVTGLVTEKDGDDYTIDGKVYNVADLTARGAAAPAAGETINVGDTITARLDFAGDIYDFEVDSADTSLYGVLTAYQAQSSFVDAKANIFTTDDAKKIFTLIDVEDVEWTTGAAMTAPETFGTSPTALVAYGLDADGKIDAISGKTTIVAEASNITLVGNVLAGKKVAADAAVFTYSGTAWTNAKDFAVSSLANVKTGEDLAVAAGAQYVVNSDNVIVALLVSDTVADKASTDVFAAVNAVSIVKDGDKLINKITALVDGVSKTYTTTFTQGTDPQLVAGDVVVLTLNGDGKVKEVSAYDTAGVSDDLVARGTVTAVKDNGTLITVTPGGLQSVATDAIAYEKVYDGNDFDVFEVSKIASVKTGNTVTLLDTKKDADKDGVANLVVFSEYDVLSAEATAAANAAFAATTVSGLTLTDPAAYADNGSLEADWTALADAATYKVQVKAATSGGLLVKTVTVTTNSATVTGLTDDAIYFVTVTGYNANGVASGSDTDSVTLGEATPQPTVEVTFINVAKTQMVAGEVIYTANASTVIKNDGGAIIGVGDFSALTVGDDILVNGNVFQIVTP